MNSDVINPRPDPEVGVEQESVLSVFVDLMCYFLINKSVPHMPCERGRHCPTEERLLFRISLSNFSLWSNA
jgi:hypothetical protein